MADNRELVKVATMYYDEGMTQAAIAKEMGVSRSLISKMLIDAKSENIVEIFIHSDSAVAVSLERAIENQYNVKQAIVIDTFNKSDEEVRKIASQEAASYLSKISKDVQSIGVSWGKSLRGLVDHYPFKNQNDVTVIPLIGGMSDANFDIHSNQLAYDLARKMRGNVKYLYAPASIDNEELKNELVNNRTIMSVMEEGRKVDLALVGVASPYIGSTMYEIGYSNDALIENLRKHEVVGDINSRFYDKTGNEIEADFNEQTIGLRLKDLKKIPTVMALAMDDGKAQALRVALEAELINVIVLTDRIAKQIID